ncbi:MAG: aminotransferase class III-fold pyridoxal phosphate-dependent enzyme [Acidimicrobiia bacterium]|nr:aminotransferase class III-fold pyridoxal phosphate-dependent enzyme [Acidimicrobiia bacterium]
MTDDLLGRRQSALAPSYELFYDDPIEIVRGKGVHLYDANGKEYLDCYNNVASVGHSHPRVVEALTRQASTLNTHTRYLHHSVVDLAERLEVKLGGDLSSAFFVCTGSEANDLAVRIARNVTGHNGVIVNDHSYHGNSTLIDQLSLSHRRPGDRVPDWIGVAEAPNTYRGTHTGGGAGVHYAGDVRRAGIRLRDSGVGVAAFLVDSTWDANGFLNAPKDYLSLAARHVRDLGGLVIADEVQAGYCRTGETWWGFEDYDIVPDIVTLGKPMGAGHPVAAVITTPEIARSFAEADSYFNTFGGNPVSCEVALAVIDVIDDEQLLDNVDIVGAVLRDGLEQLSRTHDIIGTIHGKGLFWGVELVGDRETKEPMSESRVNGIVSDLCDHGVLTGTNGPHHNIIKIRPPLVFSEADASQALEALDGALVRFAQENGNCS